MVDRQRDQERKERWFKATATLLQERVEQDLQRLFEEWWPTKTEAATETTREAWLGYA